jgi:glucosamine--fructose-6-phosphate aminotransferase (isomerizing)
VALTNATGSAVAEAADVVLPLGSGPDSRVSTLSYTATVQALGMLAEALGAASSTVDWHALPDLASTVLDTDIETVVDALAAAGCVDVVGGGVHAASASAAALLLREAAHLPAAGHTTREYLHGHLEIAGFGHAALVFGADRELRLAADLVRYGSSVVLVTDTAGVVPAHPQLRVLRLPSLPGLAGCVLDILPVQLAARRIAQRKGLSIELRHMPADTKVGA